MECDTNTNMRYYTIHCHPRGTGNTICCNKPSGMDIDLGAMAQGQGEDDSDVE